MAGVVVVDAHPWPQRPPALIAALIAACVRQHIYLL